MDCRVKPGNDEIKSRSRGAPLGPSHVKQRERRMESIRNSPFAMHETSSETECRWWCLPLGLREAKNEKDSEAKRRQTQGSSAVPTGTAAPQKREAHIYRRSTAVLVPRSLSSQGTQHQAFASWDVAARVSLSVERALPAPTCPSPARPSQPSRSARRLMPECRPGAGCNSARGHRTRPREPGTASQAASEKGEVRNYM